MNICDNRGKALLRGFLLCLMLGSMLGLMGCQEKEEGANDPNYVKGKFVRPGAGDAPAGGAPAAKGKGKMD